MYFKIICKLWPVQIQWNNNHVLLMEIFWALNWEEVLVGTPGNTINFPFPKFKSKTRCRLRFKQMHQWIDFIRRTHTLATWCKQLTHGKDPDVGKDWRQEEKGTTEDEMAGWHHQLNGHGLEQAPGDGEGPGNLGCCSPWGCKELDMTEQWQLMNLVGLD